MVSFLAGDFSKKRLLVACQGFSCKSRLQIFGCFAHFFLLSVDQTVNGDFMGNTFYTLL